MISPCSRNRSSFGWTSSGRSPISSRNSVPPAADANEARLIGHRAGEAPAPVAEQLAVGQIALSWSCSCRGGTSRAARRSDVDRARHELLAGAALAGDEHGQVVALQPLDLIGHAVHRRARAEEAGQQRLERALVAAARRRWPRRSRAPHNSNPCRATAPNMRKRRMRTIAERTRERDQRDARAVVIAAERLGDQEPLADALSPCAAARASARPRRHRIPAMRHDAHLAGRRHDEDHRGVRFGRLREAPWRSRAPAGRGAPTASIRRRTTASSASAGDADEVAGASAASSRARAASTSSRSRCAPSVRNTDAAWSRWRSAERARARPRREAPERQLAQRGLVALAEQLEDVRALREVVVAAGAQPSDAREPRRGCAGTRPSSPARCADRAAPSHESIRRCAPPRCGPAATSASHAARSAWIASAGGTPGVCGDLVGHRHAPRRTPPRRIASFDAEHFQRPLVPAHRLRAVRAVRLARAGGGIPRRARIDPRIR